VDLHLGVLLGEAGADDRLRRILGEWQARGEPLDAFADMLGAAYLGEGSPTSTRSTRCSTTLGPGLVRDALLLRLGAQLGDARRPRSCASPWPTAPPRCSGGSAASSRSTRCC
jgi:hypothetical protein